MAYQIGGDPVASLGAQCSLFGGLSEQMIKDLEATGKLLTYHLDAGEQVSLRGRDGEDAVYLVEGEVTVTQGGQEYDLDRIEHQCRPVSLADREVVSFRAVAPSRLCRADRDNIDYLLGWKTLVSTLAPEKEDLQRTLARLRNPAVFMHLPFSNVEEAFRRMTRREVRSGEEIMQQGDIADNFYVIESGVAEVWQQGAYDDEHQLVAELGTGSHFGEDALVGDCARNATIRIKEGGTLLVLDGEDFRELIRKPMLHEIDVKVAKTWVDSGDRELLDVRYEEEWDDARIPGATLIPLHELRNRIDELSSEKGYITYCLSGKRSAVAAMILAQQGIDAVCMKGGIRDWPYATENSY
jgi:rhodanese-related sulfurtransferase